MSSLNVHVTPTPRIAVNGVHLNVKMMGNMRGIHAPLVLLHGFTGSSKSWSPHSTLFRQYIFTITVDLLGHGGSDSPLDPARYRMEKTISDLISVFDQLGLRQVDLLGYSMGGRVALALAATYPGRVNKLILESASPGLSDPTDRRARMMSDESLAELIEQNGLEAFVEQWSRLPLFASQKRLPDTIREELRAQRLQNNIRGLANTLRGLGTGVQPSYWDKLGEVKMPTLLITGALDRKFIGVARQMAEAMPEVRLAVVPDAGHTVHLEQSALYDQLVLDFLAEPLSQS